MRIIFDNIIFSLQKSGGISVFWSILISTVMKDPEFDCYFIERPDAQRNIFRKDIYIPPGRIISKPRLPLHLDRNRSIRLSRKNIEKIFGCREATQDFIFHSSYYRTCSHVRAKNVTTLHDFTYELMRHRGFLASYLHARLKRIAIKDSEFIACVSNSTAKDLYRIKPEFDSNRTEVIYNAPLCRPSKKIKKDNKESDYILYVGDRSSYKNFKLAVKGTALTNKKLVICGSPLNAAEKKMLDSVLGSERHIEYVYASNLKLSRLYAGAFCLAYPSAYEGFGIPVIEAQAHGCPSVIMDTPATVEIGGEGTIVMHAATPEAFRDAVNRLKDNALRQRIIEEGKKNQKRFSWHASVKRYCLIYKDILSSKES